MQKIKILLLAVAAIVLVNQKINATIASIPYTAYRIHVDSCKVIRHSTGSLIFVPSHAFTDEKGKKLSGYVTLNYREFRTPADMVSANIPMIYEENGKRHQLQSAGMFEIQVVQNLKELLVAKGKKIQVRMASPNDLAGLESYILNKAKNTWEKLSTPVMDFSYATKKDNLKNINSEYDRRNKIMVKYDGDIIPLDTFSALKKKQKDSIQYQPEMDSYDPNDPFYKKYDSIYKYQQQVFKSLNVDKMGLYNYDMIYHREDAIPFAVRFHLKGDTAALNQQVFVVYDNLNMVIKYEPYQFAAEYYMLPQKNYRIFAILPDGKVAIMPTKKRLGIDISSLRGKSFDFELEVHPKLITTRNELALATGIK
ncbi:MAG: hypothetical protein NTX03_03595 [Bacteroidetes bacterium]|nr:hypothetical protein [Bacteroidota bacterium]